MNTKTLNRRATGLALALLAAGVVGWVLAADKPARPKRAIPQMMFKPREMADAIHAVIAADREVYAKVVVQRLATDAKIIGCSENWESEKTLPTPSQMLRLGSESVASGGAEFAYTLRALTPINPRNALETETERRGMEAVTRNPDEGFYEDESLGGRRYLTAVYADKAVTAACVSCHNTHPQSARKDFKVGDVMGAIVIRVALEF